MVLIVIFILIYYPKFAEAFSVSNNGPVLTPTTSLKTAWVGRC